MPWPLSRALHIACADIDHGALFPVQFTEHPGRCVTDRQRWEQARAEQSMADIGEKLYRSGDILGWSIKDTDVPCGARLDNYPTVWATRWSMLRLRLQTLDRRFVPQSAHRDRPRELIHASWMN